MPSSRRRCCRTTPRALLPLDADRVRRKRGIATRRYDDPVIPDSRRGCDAGTDDDDAPGWTNRSVHHLAWRLGCASAGEAGRPSRMSCCSTLACLSAIDRHRRWRPCLPARRTRAVALAGTHARRPWFRGHDARMARLRRHGRHRAAAPRIWRPSRWLHLACRRGAGRDVVLQGARQRAACAGGGRTRHAQLQPHAVGGCRGDRRGRCRHRRAGGPALLPVPDVARHDVDALLGDPGGGERLALELEQAGQRGA